MIMRKIALIAFCVLPALLVISCGKDDKNEAKTQRVVNVITAKAIEEKRQPYITAIGTLEAFEQVIVSAEVEGIVKRADIREGGKIAKNGLVASIDDINYRLSVSQAQAAYNQALANLQNTAAEFARREALFKEQLATKQDFENIRTRYELAKQELERAASTLAIANERLSKCQVLAPLAGFIKDKLINAGDFVRVGSPLCVIINTDSLKLAFSVTESEAARLKVGQEVVFSLTAFPDREFRGRISALAANLEERTRTLRAEATLPNLGYILKPGYFSKVSVLIGKSVPMVLIPVNAILYEGKLVRVFVVSQNSTAQMREVKLGGKYGEMVEIIEGMKAGEEVIVVGQSNLAEGTNVHVAR